MSLYLILFLIMPMFNNWFTKFLEIEQLALTGLFGPGPPAGHGVSEEGGKGMDAGFADSKQCNSGKYNCRSVFMPSCV